MSLPGSGPWCAKYGSFKVSTAPSLLKRLGVACRAIVVVSFRDYRAGYLLDTTQLMEVGPSTCRGTRLASYARTDYGTVGRIHALNHWPTGSRASSGCPSLVPRCARRGALSASSPELPGKKGCGRFATTKRAGERRSCPMGRWGGAIQGGMASVRHCGVQQPWYSGVGSCAMDGKRRRTHRCRRVAPSDAQGLGVSFADSDIFKARRGRQRWRSGGGRSLRAVRHHGSIRAMREHHVSAEKVRGRRAQPPPTESGAGGRSGARARRRPA